MFIVTPSCGPSSSSTTYVYQHPQEPGSKEISFLIIETQSDGNHGLSPFELNQGEQPQAMEQMSYVEAVDQEAAYQASFTEPMPLLLDAQRTVMRDLSSIRPGRWLSDTVVNDWAEHMIASFGLQDRFLYVPTYLYRSFFDTDNNLNKLSNIIKFLISNRAYNKDILLVGIPGNIRGSHWMLGVISFNSKKLTILDPMKASRCNTNYNMHVNNLLRIVAIARTAAGLPFVRTTEWQCYYAIKYPRQVNESDCGVFVCHYIYQIVMHRSLTELCPLDMRRRIDYVLSKARKIETPGRIMTYSEEEISSLIAYCTAYYHVDERRFALKPIDDLFQYPAYRNEIFDKCADSICGQFLSFHSDTVFCILCRQTFHTNCVQADLKADYFTCTDCFWSESFSK